MGFFTDLFTGGAVKSIENIAKEWIDTPGEKANAEALMIKTLDPNGLMRREISSNVTTAYMMYLYITMILVLLQSFGIGNDTEVNNAITNLTDLFIPITAMFSAIVGASFGVNGINSTKGK